MKPVYHQRCARKGEAGYALLLIMFFLALLVISSLAAAPTVLSTIQREKEAEMVWRGHQYTRAIRMYYLKMHHFPTSLDDLTKPKTGIRFMRQAYKDPMNQADGSWRLIYVGPNGQLIGSLSNRSIGLTGQAGAPVAGQGFGSSAFSSSGASGFGSSGIGSSGIGSSGFGGSLQGASSLFGSNSASGTAQGTEMGTAFQTSTSSTGTSTNTDANNPQVGDTLEDPGQPHSIAGPMDASNTIGGNIIGVGSKVDRKSFMWYQKAKNYKFFEFIWDPSKDTTMGGASAGIGTPVQNMNGMSPAGAPNSPFSSGINGTQNPSQNQSPSQNQNPSPNQNSPFNPDPNTNPPLQAPPSNE